MAFFYALSHFNFMEWGHFVSPHPSPVEIAHIYNPHERGPPKEKETLSGHFFFLVFFVFLCGWFLSWIL